ncbi:Glutamate racemase [Raphidiopsis brookii D9]|nr:Glutamate racemase [Raphidiopsis brookii D9]
MHPYPTFEDNPQISNQFLTLEEIPKSPIGVFDSGVGGLTVLRQVYQQLPNESVIYFGDTAHLPYGIRSQKEILGYVREILNWMEQQGVKMVIMACNTSSALTLETVRLEYKFPILGMISPATKFAVNVGKRIGVIATPATAKSNAYRQAIMELKPNVQVWQVSCPEFVPLIEQNRLHDPYTLAVAKSYLEPLLAQEIDTLIYGCTHYPLLEPIIKTLIPNHIHLVDPAVHVVRVCQRELEILNIKNHLLPMPTRFVVSGSPQHFSQSGTPWLGYTPLVEQVQFCPTVPYSLR